MKPLQLRTDAKGLSTFLQSDIRCLLTCHPDVMVGSENFVSCFIFLTCVGKLAKGEAAVLVLGFQTFLVGDFK